MTLAELHAAIASYTENVFDVSTLNTFIRQAEQRINTSVQLPAARLTSMTTATATFPTVPVPANYLAPYSLAVVNPTTGDLEYLLFKDPSFLREAFPTGANVGGLPGSFVGRPTHYAQVDPYVFILGPVPDMAYSLQLVYFGYPPSITVAGTSWLGDNFSPALLYGALVEAYIYMKGEPDIMTVYDTKFKEALELLKQLVDARARQDSYRSGQTRYPVL
jgi:hypothetical protein